MLVSGVVQATPGGYGFPIYHIDRKIEEVSENVKRTFAIRFATCKIIRNPPASGPPLMIFHERSRFATCQWELSTPTDISIPLTHRLVLRALEAGECLSAFKKDFSSLKGQVGKLEAIVFLTSINLHLLYLFFVYCYVNYLFLLQWLHR